MKFQINSDTDYQSFQKIPKKNRKFEEEGNTKGKKKSKKDYSQQRERKREAFE